MRDILDEIKYWFEGGKSIALATVIQTWGSAPRGVGSKMAITADGEFAGSVSGGCVENAVIEAGIRSLKTNRAEILHFGVADETAWDVGLACGGSIDIFVQPLDKRFFEEMCVDIQNNQPTVTATIVRGPDDMFGRQNLLNKNSHFKNLFANGRQELVENLASEVLARRTSQCIALDEETEIFFDAILPPPTLILVGGVNIAVALAKMAKTLEYRTVLIDPRRAWGNKDRFPQIDELIQAWPEDAFNKVEITPATAVAMLTHDPRLDDPALKIALSSPAFYVGALGSEVTNEKRRARLISEGVTEAQFSRLHAPIGLNIGARSPEEIALAIMAEVVESYRKRKQAGAQVEAVPGSV